MFQDSNYTCVQSLSGLCTERSNALFTAYCTGIFFFFFFFFCTGILVSFHFSV